MKPTAERPCTAFIGTRKVASGDVMTVALKVKNQLEKDPTAEVHVFDDRTGAFVELDLRGSLEAVEKRMKAVETSTPKPTGPGRPKLGVVSREIGLLPRHWDWLALQPGGASVTLRKLVDEAEKKNRGRDEIRQAQEATYKFLTVMAGNLPDFEEVLRAFYARDKNRFAKLMADWPEDIREHAQTLAEQTW